MIVNNNIQEQKVDPKVNVQKAKQFILDLYKDGGRNISEELALKYASSPQLKEDMANIYRRSGNRKKLPKDNGLSIYMTFLEDSPIEKKNLLVNESAPVDKKDQDSAFQLPSGNGTSQSNSNANGVESDSALFGMSEDGEKKVGYNYSKINDEKGAYYNFNGTFNDLVDSIPIELFQTNEENVVQELSSTLNIYGYKISSSGFGNQVSITGPSGESQDFRLYTEGYKNQLSRQYLPDVLSGNMTQEQSDKNVDMLMRQRFDKFKGYLKNNVSLAIDAQKKNFQNTSLDILPLKIQQWIKAAIRPGQKERIKIVNFLGDEERNSSDYLTNTFDQSLWEKDLFVVNDIMKKRLEKSSENIFAKDKPGLLSTLFNKQLREEVLLTEKQLKESKENLTNVSTIIKDYNDGKKYASSTVGHILKVSGVYNKINLNDQEYLATLEEAGLSMGDMPLEQIRINDRPASFNDLSKALFDYEQLLAIREGDLKISVSNPEEAGLLAGYVQNALDLIRTQEAYETNGVFGYKPKKGSIEAGVINWFDITSENLENFAQSVGLGAWEIGVNTGYIMYDSLVGLGVPEHVAEAMIYGQTGIPGIGNFGALMNPKLYDKVRNELLPKYDGDIVESGSIGESIAKLVEPVGNSMATTSIFLLNPYAGLATVGVSGYGGNLKSYTDQINAIKEKKSQGLFLTENEINLMNMSESERRLVSGGKAATEAAITSMFTFKYFKSLKNKIPKGKSFEETRKFANSYSKAFRKTYATSLSNLTGIDTKLLLAEIPEEQMIVFSNYLTDIILGTDDWNPEKAVKLFFDTGITTLASTKVTSHALKYYNKAQLRNFADGLILNNLSIKGDNQVYIEKLAVDSQIKKLETDAASNKKSLEGDSEYEFLKKNQSEINSKIDKIELRKKQLLSEMSQGDKISFIDGLAELEKSFSISKDPSKSAPERIQAQNNLNEQKQEVRKILSNYPSELSYFFAEDNIKSEYSQKALDLLTEEKINNGEKDFVLNTEDEVVQDQAAKLYLQDIRQKKREFNNELYVFEGKGLGIDPSELNVDVSESELDDFNLANSISIAKEIDSQGDIFSAPTEQTGEVKEESEDVTLARATQTLSQNVVTPQETQTDQPVPTAEQVELDRRSNILKRIEGFNIDGSFFKGISEQQQKIVVDYFNDVKNKKRPKYGLIESVLNAHDIAVQISAMTPNQIKLMSKAEGETPLVKILAAINNGAQGIYAGQIGGVDLATTDVLMQMLIKDTNVGKPLYDLVQESIRSSAEAQNESFEIEKTHRDQFVKDVNEYYNKNKKGISKLYGNAKNWVKGKLNPNDLENSYEQFILGSLIRKNGEIDPLTGQDKEFVRMKGLILQERDKAKADYDNAPSYNKTAYKTKYDTWNNVVNRLDIENATSYEDVSSKAFDFNVKAVDRMRQAFSQNFDGIESRIKDFRNSGETFYERDNYVPIYMRDSSWESSYSDYFGTNSSSVMSNTLKDTTRPESLDGDLRLSPGLYFNSVYSSLRGSNMESKAYKNFETLDQLLTNPTFTNLFEDGTQKELLLNALRKRKGFFERDVRRTNMHVVDVTSNKFKDAWGKFSNAAYGAISAVSLTRSTQAMSQFISAIAGTKPLMKNKEAKKYLNRRSIQFFTFTNGFSNGNKAGNQLTEIVGKLIPSANNGRLANIYSKSRTGLRNSLLSELAIDENQKLPMSYYANAFKLDLDAKSLADTSKYTFDQFMNLVNKSTKMSLDLWLANADRLAAYSAFEAHYLDYKISQGETIPADMNSWWSEQDKNPDLAAIRHADFMIAKVMRQTDATSEADIYQQDQNQAVKLGLRTIYPFHKFILNAKADLSNQVSILLDPNIPEEQKQFARQSINGRMQEILSFNVVKNLGKVATINGLGALLAFSVDEDDIEEYGGINKYINETALPITSPNDSFDPNTASLESITNLEDYAKYVGGFKEFDDISKKINAFSKKYEKKIEAKKVYSPTEFTIRDLISTMNPLPIFDLLEEVLIKKTNDMFGVEMTEFVSSDIKNSQTTDGFIRSLLDQAGLIGIGKQQYDAYDRATNIKNGMIIKDTGVFGPKEFYLTAPNGIMREKLKNAADLLYYLRVTSLTFPGAPRAELDGIADALERSIDKFFTGGKMDMEYMKLIGVEPVEEDQE